MLTITSTFYRMYISIVMSNKEPLPPSRFPDRPIEQAEGKWWIAKVKARQEKKLAFDFVAAGVEYYLPLYKKVYTRPGETTRKRIFTLPLFPGYIVFAQDTPQNIYRTGRVAQLIEVRNQSRFIKEISAIYSALEGGMAVMPLEEGFEIEDDVEVVSGLLRGIKGKIAEIRNSRYLMLEVEGLGKALVKVDIRSVKKLP